MNVSFEQFIGQKKIEKNQEWREPLILDFSDGVDIKKAKDLYKEGQIRTSIDNIDTISEDLFSVLYPNPASSQSKKDEFMDNMARKGIKYGKWVLFPWLDELVHYPPKEDHQLLRTARNRNLVTTEEQERLLNSSIGIFGLSVGSRVCESLVVSGIGGSYVIGDPDIISLTNLNRISGSVANLNETKISKTAKNISLTDPYVKQSHYPDGFTDTFLTDEPINVLVDEADDLKSKVAMRLYSRENAIPLIMASDVGDNSIIDIERYDLGYDKPFHGKIKEKDLEIINSGDFTDAQKRKYLAKLIGLSNVSTRLISSIMEQEKTLAGVPQLANTAVIGGGLAAIACREILLDRNIPSGRYILKTKKLLNMKSPSNRAESIKIFFEALKTIKSNN